MTLEQALAFFVFSVVAAGTPGPSNTLLTATGANVGVLRGLPCLLGVALGMGLMMFVVAFGLGSVILDHPPSWRASSGAAPRCCAGSPGRSRPPAAPAPPWPARRSASSARRRSSGSTRSPGSCAPARPRPSSRTGPSSALAQSAAFGLTFVLASLPSCLPWLAFGAVLQRVLRSERAPRIFNGVMGALLAASVILIVW